MATQMDTTEKDLTVKWPRVTQLRGDEGIHKASTLKFYTDTPRPPLFIANPGSVKYESIKEESECLTQEDKMTSQKKLANVKAIASGGLYGHFFFNKENGGGKVTANKTSTRYLPYTPPRKILCDRN